jgi:hypothetical protein
LRQANDPPFAKPALPAIDMQREGSDFPYRPLGESADTMGQLGLSENDLAAIGRGNALGLLPRLKAG